MTGYQTPRPRSHIVLLYVMLLALVVTTLTIVSRPLRSESTAAPVSGQNQVVPEDPRTDFPDILDGRVLALERVGSRIVVGGDFTTIRLEDGSEVSQPYVAAFFIDSGAFDTGFRPQLDGLVNSIEAADRNNTAYIGGRFTTIDGASVARLTKWDFALQAPDGRFRAGAPGQIKDIEYSSGRLFVGGDFTRIRGVARERLAELDPASGKPVASFTIGVTGDRSSGVRADGLSWTGTGAIVRSLDITPDGNTLMVVHRGDRVGGETRWGAAMIDIGGPTPSVLPWRTNLWPASDFVGIIDAEMSPDGSFFVVTTHIGNFTPLHDTAIAFPVAGGADVQPLWVTQNFDSTYGVAISDAAVYIGGHFCWTEGPDSVVEPLYVPGPDGNQFSCEVFTGAQFAPETVYRRQIAALDPATGLALPWNPGSDAFNGVHTLELIDRGLLLGHDGNIVGGRTVGRMAFFDLGSGVDETLPTSATVSPGAGVALLGPAVSLIGTAQDNLSIDRVVVSVKNRDNGLWLQNGGDLAGGWQALDLTLTSPGAPETSWYRDVSLPDGRYVVNVRAFDGSDNRGELTKTFFSIVSTIQEQPPTAVVTSPAPGAQMAAGEIALGGSAAAAGGGVDSLIVTVRNRDTRDFLRRDGSWGSFQRLDVDFTADALATDWATTVSLDPGNYEVRVRAVDGGGAKSEPTLVAFTVG